MASRLQFGNVQFEVFGKLTSVSFFKLHEKPWYFILLVNNVHEKLRVNYIFDSFVHSHRPTACVILFIPGVGTEEKLILKSKNIPPNLLADNFFPYPTLDFLDLDFFNTISFIFPKTTTSQSNRNFSYSMLPSSCSSLHERIGKTRSRFWQTMNRDWPQKENITLWSTGIFGNTSRHSS